MTKAIAPAAATAVVTPPIALEPSCCTDLLLRMQAVWNAFLALLAAMVDWCANQIHGTTTRSLPEISDEERYPRLAPRMAARKPFKTAEEKRMEALSGLIEEFMHAHTMSRDSWGRTYIPHSLTLQEKAEQIKSTINMEHTLCRVANTHETQPDEVRDIPSKNQTRLLLQLGADPNGTTTWGYVPLHFAVLSGCMLAYRELRQANANPWIDNYYVVQPGRTPLELAYHMLFTNKSVQDYCWTVAFPKDSALAAFFPRNYFADRSVHPHIKPVGTLADIQKMIDFEVERAATPIQAAVPAHLPLPLARLIAGYYLSGAPNESGANLVKRYGQFYDELDPNTQGAQNLLKTMQAASVQEQLAAIQKSVESSNELFLAVNPLRTNAHTNDTELFLILGANPNRRATLGRLENFTPLHAAVLTRCPLAYKTLRAWGADPKMRWGASQEGDTPIELAQRMLTHRTSRDAHAYFAEFLLAAGITQRTFYTDPVFDYDLVLFPHYYEHSITKRSKFHNNLLGTDKELQEILDYEMLQSPTAQEVHKHYPLPADLAVTIADYAQQ